MCNVFFPQSPLNIIRNAKVLSIFQVAQSAEALYSSAFGASVRAHAADDNDVITPPLFENPHKEPQTLNPKP